MLNLPPIIIPEFYDSNNYDFLLIQKAYSIFRNDFIDNQVIFDGFPVLIEPKILDCSNCGFSCNNPFTCEKCPWAGKEDIFQHITSYEDYSLKLSYDYKKSRKNKKINTRTPGLYDRQRTERISWIKVLIESSKIGKNCEGVICKMEPDAYNKRKEKIKIYDSNSDFLIILSRTNLGASNAEIYLSSAYNNPPHSFLKNL